MLPAPCLRPLAAVITGESGEGGEGRRGGSREGERKHQSKILPTRSCTLQPNASNLTPGAHP
eukprot:2003542-Rhodomonas_salina.1